MDQAHQRWLKAQRDNQNSSERQQLQLFEDLVKTKKEDYHQACKALSALQNAQQSLEALNRTLSQCQMPIPEAQMPDGIRLLPQRRQQDALSGLDHLLRERERGLDQAKFSAQSRQQQMEQRQTELKTQIDTLEKGQMVYPDGNRARRVCPGHQPGAEPVRAGPGRPYPLRDPDCPGTGLAGVRRGPVLETAGLTSWSPPSTTTRPRGPLPA